MPRAGLGNEEKPIGSFLFAGPTGSEKQNYQDNYPFYGR
ncbi:MAG: hypothetical protein Ct9H90mP22_1610 [Gammaproteobacteria bacterium]|nr:MAG: hypothetical protein Ct9H90mP22_1610 [Gammaproteobacteria bacterium]